MPIDPVLADNVAANLLAGTAGGHLRRERFADAAASGLIAGMNHILEAGRQKYALMSDLMTAVVAGELTGANSPIQQGILAARSVQFQPGQATMVDPNYRVPPPPPAKSGV